MSEFKVIETQEQFDAMVKDRLDRERAKTEKEFKDKLLEKENTITSLQSENASMKSTIEDQVNKDEVIKNLESEIENFKLSDLKTKTAIEYGLPYSLSSRLQGTTPEELKADAENLSKYVRQSTTPPLKNLEEGNVDPKTEAYRSFVNNLNKGD